MKEILKEIRYFASFDEEKLDELSKICMFKKLTVGEILFYEGDEPQYIYYLTKGYLRILKKQANLKQIYIHTMSAGTLIAEITMFEDIDYPATAEAMVDCEVLVIDRVAFFNNFFTNVNLLQSIVKSLTMKVKYLMNSLEIETSISTELKIAKFIINHEKTINTIKHKDIAFKLNTTSETVSRILKKFKKNGFLETTNPIAIKNLHGLKILCN